MQQNVTTGLGGDLCGPLAKQTDEGNLSCRSCFAEQGLPQPTIVSVASHLSLQGGHGKRRDKGSRQGRRGEEGAEDDVKTERGEMRVIPSLKCQTFIATQ